MTNQPTSPYLVIRRGIAFWLESDAPADCSARLQAFREGCYRDAFCFDATGGLWPIDEARLKRPLSFLERIAVTRWVPIELTLGPRREANVQEVVSSLAQVLLGENEFCEHLPESPDTLLRRFEAARTPQEIVRIAHEHAGLTSPSG
ncbi:MAG TPA: hypothetical protein VFE28_14370 [Candidatus Krumholzibacteria bacterium]|nr:hypothetical protein [Candidatus Krumholzibacteria bacterium]